jgi:hypothetical protein
MNRSRTAFLPLGIAGWKMCAVILKHDDRFAEELINDFKAFEGAAFMMSRGRSWSDYPFCVRNIGSRSFIGVDGEQ